MTKIVITRPADPLLGLIEARRDAFARKWGLPTKSERVAAMISPRPTIAEIAAGLKELAVKAERIK